MKFGYIRLSVILAAGMFIIGCGNTGEQQQPPQVATTEQQELPPEEETLEEDEYWAKDNFDLQRVGPILQRSRNVEEFERYLNDDDGINNLDLNGDGYADYISVDEYGYDVDPNQRGLSLYSRFGPDLVQEIARVVFYRDEPNYPGSRVMLYGDEHIYGDDHYYETNWLDQTIGIVSALFGERDNHYRSPYYYDNYPDWYDPYYIVETPVYRTRVVELYPDPLFVYTTEPTFYDRIEIRSPYDGRRIDRVYARMVNPTREQQEFLRNNRVPPARGRRDMADGPGFSEDAPGQRKKIDGGNPGRGNPNRGNPDRGNPDRGNPNKPDKADKNQGGPPPKADRGKPNDDPGRGKGNPGKGNPNKPDKPQKAGNPNKGGGGDKGKGKGKP